MAFIKCQYTDDYLLTKYHMRGFYDRHTDHTPMEIFRFTCTVFPGKTVRTGFLCAAEQTVPLRQFRLPHIQQWFLHGIHGSF